jgi:RNA polymerase sigma-70 factor (ECF subfamily)
MADSVINVAALSRAKAGLMAEDFDTIVVEHQRGLYRLLLGLTRDPDTAATLTQDCFVRAYENRSSFRGEASVKTWLTRIAVNLARDHAKNRRQGFWRRMFTSSGTEEHERAVAAVSTGEATAERKLIASEQASAMWTLVEKLSGKQREVFTLRYAEEMELEEIARTTGMKVGTVKAHLSRALSRVREELKGQL